MKKGVFVESVLLAIGGGVLTDELNVRREDVEAYIPAAVNYAVTAGRNTSIAQDGNRDLPSMFYGTFTDLLIDRTGSVASITLPKGYIPLYGNEGVRSVFDDCGNYYAPLMDADRRTIKHYSKKLLQQGFYYPIGKDKIEVYPTNVLVEKLSGEYIVKCEDLDDDDELPLPASTETMALEQCIQWFSRQRQNPADLINNKADSANVIPK